MRFSYECECGAQGDWFGSSAEKPETLICAACGQQAQQLLCTNFLVQRSGPVLPTQKELCRALMARSNARLRRDEHKIRARDRAIVEAARSRIQAERSRPKTHGSASMVEHATVPARFAREYDMRNGEGSWNTLMKDPKALKKTLKEVNLWASGS